MTARSKLAIICSHPIQYYAPLFCSLATRAELELQVFYTWSQRSAGAAYDTGFAREFAWDVPLLQGYPYRFVANIARRAGTDHFFGLRNPELIPAIEAWKPHAVLIFGWPYYSHLQSLCHFKGRIPVLFRGDSTLLDPVSPLRRSARRAVLRWIYRHIDIAIAVGQSNRDYYLWCGVPSSRVLFAPHAVDIDRFADDGGQQRERADSWRLRLGIAPEEVAIVFAGKFQPKKDPLLLLQAYGCMRDADRQAAHLIFVGDGVLEGRLRERASRHSNVHFLPFQNQSVMPAVYRLGDLFVLPSRGPGETWGLALNEAMASGRAVIAGSRVGAARDLVRDGTTGWTFPSGDLPALASVLAAALALGRQGLHAVGAEGRRLIGSWSMAECAAGIVEAVRAAIRV
ncbi:MAG TPA: glycosyltransferase family 4 protein [Steroidobacteraceae bacterium]|nr:glycosyltransferase family 4 protein [Steroidobacteraceae bacterium]